MAGQPDPAKQAAIDGTLYARGQVVKALHDAGAGLLLGSDSPYDAAAGVMLAERWLGRTELDQGLAAIESRRND